MNEIKIGRFQFFTLLFLFELGSAVLFGMGKDVKQDAWIPALIGTLGGCLIYTVYTMLHNLYPDLPITSYSKKILGKYIGSAVGFAYIVYFIYLATRVLRDFDEMLVISQYHNTSLLTIGLYMIATIMYVMFKGFEVFSRVSLILFLVHTATITVIFALEIADNLIIPVNLLPVLEKGWIPIFKSVFPASLTVPFGELIVVTMFFRFVNGQSSIRNIGFMAIILSGLYLTFRSLINIAIIGPDVRFRSTFPIISEVGLINIANFIQRMDSFVIAVLVILGFVKVYIFYYCALSGASDLFKLKKPEKLIFPFGFIIIIFSVFIAPNFNFHMKIGFNIVPLYLHIPFQIGIPLLLLAVALIKIKRSRLRQQDC
ncbi:GerAB/ArcD/ProY family transporter [Peribacillus kribbensis]|uniref:GerAB/ArcD/ProY family transporter n=1 Tax=Peribacillus kribbensis TaxID=356658 RepID=UPI000408B461|nr:GerAB/ArcD/ProY family transporter [Peribacillus kribbensis]